MRRLVKGIAAALVAGLVSAPAWAEQETTAPVSGAMSTAAAAPAVPGNGSTADHSKFEILKQDFKSGPEVTKACLSCHTEAADQVMHSIHWKWDYTNPKTGQKLGKRNVINAFCGNVASNEARCTSCHAGYGWHDTREPIAMAEDKTDCLVCHASTKLYAKQDNLAGNPPLAPVKPGSKTITGATAVAVNLSAAAQSVGKPQRENCGQCHFYGGGGDNVKHGDLSSALVNPTKDVDVHMAADGPNFTCETCHVSDKHVFAGSRYNVTAADDGGIGLPGMRRDVATCESCHGNRPHPATLKGVKLNDHVDRVACQTCHIPEFAKGGVATKTFWDWSTAGKLKDGKPYHEEGFTQSDGKHLHTYLSTKGDFKWGENVKPHYAWFDGQVRYTTLGEKIDPAKVVNVNYIQGAAGDPKSRIWPFKLMVGRQAYDTERDTLVLNHVWGPTTDTAFWSNFDWAKSIKAAMDYVGEPYSGKFGFVDTHMYWPITHMVAPATQALDCASCHARDSRLADLGGFYMPGRDSGWGALLGKLLLALAVLGVAGHGLIRLFSGKKGGRHG